MDREILFRGKRTDNDKWVEGADVMHKTVRGELCLSNVGEDWVAVIPSTVGQYTGLTDKNGRKIFEGDIVKGDTPVLLPDYVGRIGFVRYERSAYIIDFTNLYPKWKLTKVGFCSFNNYEVIGNIYDSPELIGGDPNA